MKQRIFIGIAFVLFFSFGCSTTEKQEKVQDTNEYGPKAVKLEPLIQPVVLIFGPGMAKAFAYAGVLKAFHEQKIPIRAIVATEFGALIAGLYASSRSINEFEWKLHKFRKKVFPKNENQIDRLFSGKVDLKKAIREILVGKRIESARVPLAVGSFTTSNSRITYLERGLLSRAVESSLGEPGFIRASNWQGRPAYSLGSIRPFPVRWAKKRWNAPVIVISVTDRLVQFHHSDGKELDYSAKMSMAMISASEILQESSLTLEPDLSGIGYFDFLKIHSIIFRGRQKALAKMSQIKSLLLKSSEE